MLENIYLDTRNSEEFLMLYNNLKLLSTKHNLWRKEKEEGYRFCYANHMAPVWIIDDKIIFGYVDDKDDGYGNIVNTEVNQYAMKEGYIVYCIDYSFRKKEDRFPEDSFDFWIKTKKNKEGGKDRLCCCTETDKFTFYGKYKYVPLNKWMEISLKDGSIDMWTYKE